ncbi:MAG: DedA family protein [Melioribacteraceae bacterium]|nr:DedA family protein [Melioribacteraceae bacterium]MCF8356383.1 DedA family protein [Melioribacteraceae bacterium]MCF8395766.1 DedA family protein [Melioribacteraceae bacterium]MCF8420891.1 DedA family protein [Melioribacteraceae bacterium]
MLEEIISYMSQVDPNLIYLILFFFAFIENVFPPSPSDVVVIFGATLIVSTDLTYIPVLIITSLGSSAGFILMYLVGKFFGERVLRAGKLKFLGDVDLKKTDEWFRKWGYKLILANRFLPGTRSVISFFSGVHELEIGKTFLLSAISAFLWNAAIIYFGFQVGNNIQLIDFYLKTYSSIIVGLTVIIVIVIFVRYLINKRKNKVT